MSDKILDRNIIAKLFGFTANYRKWFILAITAS